MSRWHLHSLNARNRLTRLLPELRGAGNRAVALAGALAEVPAFDLVVRAGGPGAAMTARATAPGVIDLILDPIRWDEARFLRLLVRAMHQVMRLDGPEAGARAVPGQAGSLGEVLVGLGLAGHFVVAVLGGAPEPAEQLAPDHGLAGRALREWAKPDFDPGLWFNGQGDLPEGAGQGLAFALVSRHLARNPEATPGSLAREPAESFRMTLRAMAVEDGLNPEARHTERSR